MSAVAAVERDLRAAVSADIVSPSAAYLTDQTEARGLSGRADAVALPRSSEEAAEVVAWCYAHGVAVVPRGGGTGYAGGAVPLEGGVVLSLERLARVRSFDPTLWRMEVEAGVTTANVRRIARESGLLSVWLQLTPAPEAAWPVVGFFDGVRAGCAAIERMIGSGLPVAAIEYLDGETMRYAAAGFPAEIPDGAFCVITEADGSRDEAAQVRADAVELLGEDATSLFTPERPEEIAALWRWRDGVALRVDAQQGGKASEDIAVPLDRIAEGIEESLAIGERLGLDACSWGHAGDGNLHSTYLFSRDDPEAVARATQVSEELFALALRLGGTISGEHGVGAVKTRWLAQQLGPKASELHAAIKQAFDPKDLLNPGKKVPVSS